MRNQIHNKQDGVTLIEVMISLVITAIGLLGLASMQVNSLQYQKTSSQRGEATQAAYDFGERMRANWVYKQDTSSYLTDKAANESKYSVLGNYTATSAATHTPPHNCLSSQCDTAKVAQNDIQNWLNSLQSRLVGGAGYAIPVNGAQGSVFDVTIMWKEQGFAGLDTTCPAAVAAPVGVRCYNVRIVI